MNRSGLDPQKLHSGTLADVLDGLGLPPAFGPHLRRLNHGAASRPFLGRAYTVRWVPVRKSADIRAAQPSTWDQVKDFLAPECGDARGRVYVGGTETGRLVTDMALAGGFSASDFARRGFEAVVLGGAVRDAHVVQPLALPVVATGWAPCDTQGAYRVAEEGSWCCIDGLRIETGDWVFGDDTGVVAIPATHFDEVIARALEVEAIEDRILERVAAGERLYDVVERLGRI